jgi:hypothetical protein
MYKGVSSYPPRLCTKVYLRILPRVRVPLCTEVYLLMFPRESVQLRTKVDRLILPRERVPPVHVPGVDIDVEQGLRGIVPVGTLSRGGAHVLQHHLYVPHSLNKCIYI